MGRGRHPRPLQQLLVNRRGCRLQGPRVMRCPSILPLACVLHTPCCGLGIGTAGGCCQHGCCRGGCRRQLCACNGARQAHNAYRCARCGCQVRRQALISSCLVAGSAEGIGRCTCAHHRLTAPCGLVPTISTLLLPLPTIGVRMRCSNHLLGVTGNHSRDKSCLVFTQLLVPCRSGAVSHLQGAVTVFAVRLRPLQLAHEPCSQRQHHRGQQAEQYTALRVLRHPHAAQSRFC